MIKYISTISFSLVMFLILLLYQCDIGEFNFKFLDKDIWFLVICFYILMVIFNFVFESFFKKDKFNESIVIYNYSRVFISIRFCLFVGMLSVFFKIYIINSQASFFDYSSIRLMYLNGDIYIPVYLDVLKYFLYVSLVMSLYFSGVHSFGCLNKYQWMSFLMIALDDLCVGGRGQIAYSFCLIFLSVTLFRLMKGKSIISYRMLLLLVLVGVIFLSISFSREESTFERAIDQLITYFTGTFAATNIHIDSFLSLNTGYSYGFYFFGGIVRNLLFNNLPADYGYVDIYMSYPSGFNSFTGFAYLFNDFGALSYIFALLIPFLTCYFLYRFFNENGFFSYVICIQIWSMQLLIFRDITSKWTVWWFVIIACYFVLYYIKESDGESCNT